MGFFGGEIASFDFISSKLLGGCYFFFSQGPRADLVEQAYRLSLTVALPLRRWPASW